MNVYTTFKNKTLEIERTSASTHETARLGVGSLCPTPLPQ